MRSERDEAGPRDETGAHVRIAVVVDNEVRARVLRGLIRDVRFFG
jgi:hypothetical protein